MSLSSALWNCWSSTARPDTRIAGESLPRRQIKLHAAKVYGRSAS